MNEILRQQHMARIDGDETYSALYDGLCRECERMTGVLTDAAQGIIADVVFIERTKAALTADIKKRGAGIHVRNGRQEYWTDNKSIAAYRALTEQQRKLYNELKMTPASMKISVDTIEDDFNSF